MAGKVRNLSLYFAVLLLTLYLAGCGDTRPVPPVRVITAPEEGKSLIVFFRPSAFGASIPANIFKIKNGTASLVGIITAEEKIAYQLKPGKHLFMVVSDTADFMSAELKANKTYYSHIAPIMGRQVGRFSLDPISFKRLYSPQFNKNLENCKWVEKTPTADNWATNNMASIQSKYKQYYPKWISDGLSEKSKLLPRDAKLER